MSDIVFLVALCALVTYLTRVGGHLVLSRFGAINHRVEAALNAVPVAVLTALVAPSVATQGLAEALAIPVTALIGLRKSLVVSVSGGMICLLALRAIGS
ncbi:AzlD domain-containing protein [Roseibium polysiphoniae]|uniref:AzlD family protein n=1 Tax=Roseibium polysiphoniae TaxID=2571221 RepID=UPI0032975DFA